MRFLVGRVVSSAMNKTVSVCVERSFRHPILPKVIRSQKKYMAHDETEAIQVGDLVRIKECRPLSKHKHFVVDGVVESRSTETTALSPEQFLPSSMRSSPALASKSN
ncbi:mitochondrial ribosomal protein S17 (uS17m) [Andalucia godoyi]|uniref:Small ribosomal subunit protein uS17c n=1 Tax=Andalucia godoyi TaxID=505711 RepID=A0A8K0AGB4_ANDGO|nr:mitochondrial ribosomal protein S17 (uS17m) [Andalucia godoyi]|eukprot:ANDGO_08788.mRNA.1 mitochondrial ribosomal protein S17 (uS17m)